jgi:hypothetical protein
MPVCVVCGLGRLIKLGSREPVLAVGAWRAASVWGQAIGKFGGGCSLRRLKTVPNALNVHLMIYE